MDRPGVQCKEQIPVGEIAAEVNRLLKGRALVRIARSSGLQKRFGRNGPTMKKLTGIRDLFSGRHFDRDVITLCVRWYPCYKPSLRDLVEMMAERGLNPESLCDEGS